ncbi:MAG: tRNA (guanosine(37)-N1)-methyltransferase TrmD [Clostridiales Family XIII bacterium]|jgi:tRNA (guanine37-N1)-methyltransferase|nr:tRNA (guanosine(37)-N1)-methyltransferase TrmD [Clostridiales Family XIII bacterium]
MKIDILTIFPEMFGEVMRLGVIGRASDNGVIDVGVHDIRSYSTDKHRRTDDEPFGGGAGMVMTVQPIAAALDDVDPGGGRRVYMSPRGRMLDLPLAEELRGEERLVILCGRYEGVDQRVIDAFGFEEVSIGDYILTGGELPAMVLVDAVCRLIPGILGSEESHDVESVYSGLLEYPQYTRPAEIEVCGEMLAAPEVLLSGHHRRIGLWQYRHALELTKERRPDLFRKYLDEHGEGGASSSGLGKEERAILAEVSVTSLSKL